jgi:hypothetical protein
VVVTLPRRAANAVLALWVCVASTCGAVAHAHDGGDRPHSHHLGLLSLAGPPPAGPAAPHGPGVRHWHLIVLGVECGGIPADGDDPPPSDPHPAVAHAPDLGAAKPAADAGPAPLLPAAAAPAAGPPPLLIEPPPGGSPPTIPPLTSVCAKAALARSGVRLA